MKRLAFLALFPLTLFGQNLEDRAEPPLMFSEEPVMRVDPAIREQWMDGPEAFEKEIARNQSLLLRHQFPLGKVLLFVALGLAAAAVIVLRERIAGLIERWRRKPPKPSEVSREQLDRLEQFEDWSERYLHLGRIVREYIQNKHQIRADVQTKEELLANEVFDQGKQKKLKRLFDEIERVVYAGVPPKEQDYQKSRKIVEDVVET